MSDTPMHRLLDMVRELEWSGTRYGPGDGPHSSGIGRPHPACPICGQLRNRATTEFHDSAVGHKPDCRLDLTLMPFRGVI